MIKFCKGTGLRRGELSDLRGGELRTKAQIEQEISRLEAIPEQKRTKAETGRLGVLKDTRLFDS